MFSTQQKKFVAMLEVVRGDTLVACEGAIVYFKRIAADTAGSRTAGSELARKFEKHDSRKDVSADDSWVTVVVVTGYRDATRQRFGVDNSLWTRTTESKASGGGELL